MVLWGVGADEDAGAAEQVASEILIACSLKQDGKSSIGEMGTYIRRR